MKYNTPILVFMRVTAGFLQINPCTKPTLRVTLQANFKHISCMRVCVCVCVCVYVYVCVHTVYNTILRTWNGRFLGWLCIRFFRRSLKCIFYIILYKYSNCINTVITHKLHNMKYKLLAEDVLLCLVTVVPISDRSVITS